MNHQAVPNDTSKDSSFGVDAMVQKVDSVYADSGSDLPQVQKGLLSAMTQLVALTRVVRDCLQNESELVLNESPDPAQLVQRLEKDLALPTAKEAPAPESHPQLMCLPNVLGSIRDSLENMLICCRAKREYGIRFSQEVNEELGRLLGILLLMMQDSRTVFVKPTHQSVQRVLSEGERLGRRLLEFRIDHLHRVEANNCHYQAGPMYIYILDSIGSVKAYLEKVCRTLLEAGFDAPESK